MPIFSELMNKFKPTVTETDVGQHFAMFTYLLGYQDKFFLVYQCWGGKFLS